MPTLCSAAVKEIVNQTLSDVIIDGVAGDFACLPSDRTKLFATDKVHLSADGQAVVANAVLDALTNAAP